MVVEISFGIGGVSLVSLEVKAGEEDAEIHLGRAAWAVDG